MPNILVTGANGQLGSELRELVAHSALNTQQNHFYFTDKATLDITDKIALNNFCVVNRIEVIINCAAYTAVDKAENEPERANTINHLAVKYMAEVSKEHNIRLIHISTDYVFDGKNYKPYTEDDTTNPQNVYGKTKLLGENAIKFVNPKNAVIIRTSWVYSSFGNNFVKTMLRLGKERDELGVIFDQVGTPTYAKDLAIAILHIIQNTEHKTQNTETYHFSNEGVASWYDFAKAIFELSDITCKISPIESSEYPTPAKRPHYSLFNKKKLKKQYKIYIPYWKDALQEALQKMEK